MGCVRRAELKKVWHKKNRRDLQGKLPVGL